MNGFLLMRFEVAIQREFAYVSDGLFNYKKVIVFFR